MGERECTARPRERLEWLTVTVCDQTQVVMAGHPRGYNDYSWPRESPYDPALIQQDSAHSRGLDSSNQLAIDPALALTTYSAPQIDLQRSHSSDPSSRGTGSPNSPFESPADSNHHNGKRTSLSTFSQASSRKKPRTSERDDDIDTQQERDEKSKPTRGSR